MYGNGGYLMLDFKNISLTSNPINFKGMYNRVLKTNKPIVVVNCPSISDGLDTLVTSSRSTTTQKIILTTFLANRILQILISPNDDVIYTSNPVGSVDQLKVESEVV